VAIGGIVPVRKIFLCPSLYQEQLCTHTLPQQNSKMLIFHSPPRRKS
jgi:hypothetical protein